MKKPKANSRVAKYFVARQEGKSKGEAQIVAGFPDTKHASRIEKTEEFKDLEKKYYSEVLLNEISLEQIAKEHVKNIKQDQDRGAKNKAIEMAMARIEPDKVAPEKEEQILVVMKK